MKRSVIPFRCRILLTYYEPIYESQQFSSESFLDYIFQQERFVIATFNKYMR